MKPVRYLNDYVLVYRPDHPAAMTSDNWEGYVYEHIVVIEKKIGRRLRDDEEVHHLDLDRSNNDPTNLIVLEKSQHRTLHHWINKGAPLVKNKAKSQVKKTTARYCNREGCNEVLITSKTYCSPECTALSRRKVNRPNKETLANDIDNMSYSAIGRKYKVSDNTIRKWAKQYQLI